MVNKGGGGVARNVRVHRELSKLLRNADRKYAKYSGNKNLLMSWNVTIFFLSSEVLIQSIL